MRTVFIIGAVAVLCAPLLNAYAQDEIFCGTQDTSAVQPFSNLQQMINTSMNLALVFVDFQDGRKPDGSLPTVDADTVYFTGDSIDAVGGMGYVNPPGRRKMIRKYVYEDYWDWMFSDSTYVGTRHPDNQSHGIEVYGSVKDYYREVSYDNLTITPAQTWSFPPNNYRQGIVNAIDTANGKRYVRWIVMPHPKTYYYSDGGASLLVGDLDSTLRARHSLPTGHPDYVDFVLDNYWYQRIMIISAGSNYAGYAGIWIGGNPLWIQTVEKARPNTQPDLATLQGIKVPVHEIGHSIGFGHVQAGSYDPMNQGVWGIYSHCPTHFNPWYKLMAGWIPFSNVVRINSETSATIYPTETMPSFAVVTIYGDAGRQNVWGHSEYFLVEYRRRQKFDRFIGGQFATGFDGGMLVWQYSSSGNFSVFIPTGGNAQIIPKVADDLNMFYLNTGDPAHFYAHNGSSLTPTTWPNTNARIDSITGISLTNFQKTPSSASFSVQYGRGLPTQYDDYLFGVVTGQHSGLIYMDWINGVSSFTISEGSTLDVFPSYVTVANIVAQGSTQLPIVFRGVGYQGNHAPWLSLQVGQGNYSTRITHCEFQRSGGLIVQFSPWDPILGGPVIQQNTFVATSGEDLSLNYYGDDPNTLPFLNGYDQNTFTAMRATGSWRCSSEFTILPGRTFSWGNRNPHLPETLDFCSTGGISIYGTFNLPRIPYFQNARVSFLGEGSINGVLRFIEFSTLISHKSEALLELNTALSVEPNSSLTFEGDPVSFNGSFASLACKENSYLHSIPSLDFSQGATFAIEPGATLSSRQASALSISYGALSAIGSEEQPILFTSPIGWSGIALDNSCHATATLEYVTIKNASTAISLGDHTNFSMDHSTIDSADIGVQIVPNAQNCPVMPPAKLIKNSSFTNIRNTGILVTGFSDLVLDNNVISASESQVQVENYGIYCISSSPQVLHSRITGFWQGLRCESMSSPVLEDGKNGGYNVITQNYSGVDCDDASDAVLGFISGQLSDEGGQNSIFGNFDFDVVLQTKCIVAGENNWYGSKDDPPGTFYVDESSIFNYDPWLDHDPNEQQMKGATLKAQSRDLVLSTKSDEPPIPGRTSFLDSLSIGRMRSALAKRLNGQYAQALGLLRAIVTDQSLPPSVRKWAFRQLLAVAQRMQHPNLSGYLVTALSSYPTLARDIRGVLPAAYLHEGSIEGVRSSYDFNLQQFPNTELARAAYYGKFLLALYYDHNPEAARTIYQQLANEFPASANARVAAVQLANFNSTTRRSHPNGIDGGKVASETLNSSIGKPSTFALYQNYPNPFNPTTVIRYDLPIDGHVTLKVYDVLGREVLTLLDGNRLAGYHQTVFDASGLSSGTYFYRLRAGDYVSVKKLLLLR